MWLVTDLFFRFSSTVQLSQVMRNCLKMLVAAQVITILSLALITVMDRNRIKHHDDEFSSKVEVIAKKFLTVSADHLLPANRSTDNVSRVSTFCSALTNWWRFEELSIQGVTPKKATWSTSA